MKYTFLFYNTCNEIQSIALRVKAEGYPIYLYKHKTGEKDDSGVGLFTDEEIVYDLYDCISKFIDKKDKLIIIVDDNGHGNEVDYLRNEGWKVVGGSSWADQIEYERSKGLDLMEKTGLPVPYEEDFNSIDEAIKFMEGEDDDARYVFKPEGDDFAGSSRTYTGKNKQDLIDYLKWTKSDMLSNGTAIGKFVLQEFIEGIEADFSCYVSDGKFVDNLVLIDIEEKKGGDGNKGAATGCMGNIVINVGKSKYFDKYLKPLEPYLEEANYTGDISINNIFSAKTQGKHKVYEEGQPYGIEYTPRMGWDAHTTEMAILKDSKLKISDFYIALAEGKKFNFPVGKVGCGIRVYTSSIDLNKKDSSGRFFSFDKSIAKNLWFYEVSYKDKSFITEGNPIMVVNTVGKNLANTISDCYAILKEKVNVPDVYYRMEIGKRADEVMKFLSSHGWI